MFYIIWSVNLKVHYALISASTSEEECASLDAFACVSFLFETAKYNSIDKRSAWCRSWTPDIAVRSNGTSDDEQPHD